MGTIPESYLQPVANAKFEDREMKKWIACADALDVMNGKARYSSEQSVQSHIATAGFVLKAIADGVSDGTISELPDMQVDRSEKYYEGEF